MSEVVVRMEMPTENTTCELNCYSNFYREWRCIIKDKRCDHNKNGMFPPWCPIICQLPDGHGRIADADALKEWLIEQIDYYKRFDGPNCSMMVSAYEAVCRVINDATTIVPAEEERSET